MRLGEGYILMRRKKKSIFSRHKIDRIWLPLSKHPTGSTMVVPSVFCERCTTDNQCDTCYTTQWILYCKQFDLCTVCGVPNHMETLSEDVIARFICTTSPCEGCRPRQVRYLQSRDYCLVCFQKMVIGICYTCYCLCDPEEDMCKPYECDCSCDSCRRGRLAYDQAMKQFE
jgi:hypothetical protein